MNEQAAINTLQINDIILIGAGIMSATLGTFLKELDPSLSIKIFERSNKVASESSDAWNNAGTGHSGLCELNYTPERDDGSIDISKAEKVAEQFEVSKQFWAYLTENGHFKSSHDFIHSCPQMSLVFGEEDVAFLKKRYEAMQQSSLFKDMKFADDVKELVDWIPLIMQGRDTTQKLAATRCNFGTDVNFGALTRNLFQNLAKQEGVELYLNQEVQELEQLDDGTWILDIENLEGDYCYEARAKFVFIGAGGGALPLLEKSDIEEGTGFGGFPISGEWLICNNKSVIDQHHAKVYGKAAVGSPPMSVPHLDTRIIDGEKALLFGPYAGFSTRFLKEGSLWDLPRSIHLDNLVSMIGAGANNLNLVEYLLKQISQSKEDRLEALQEFVPNAKIEDWELAIAGQRVQIIKRDASQGGILEFGTEIVSKADNSLAALLGASPGASTSVSIMLNLLNRCFGEKMKSEAWQTKLKEMIPTYGQTLSKNEVLCKSTRQRTHEILGLDI